MRDWMHIKMNNLLYLVQCMWVLWVNPNCVVTLVSTTMNYLNLCHNSSIFYDLDHKFSHIFENCD